MQIGPQMWRTVIPNLKAILNTSKLKNEVQIVMKWLIFLSAQQLRQISTLKRKLRWEKGLLKTPLYSWFPLYAPHPWKSSTSGVGTSLEVEYPFGRCSLNVLSISPRLGSVTLILRYLDFPGLGHQGRELVEHTAWAAAMKETKRRKNLKRQQIKSNSLMMKCLT